MAARIREPVARRKKVPEQQQKHITVFPAGPQASDAIRRLAIRFLAAGVTLLMVGIAGLLLMVRLQIRPPVSVIAVLASLTSLGAAGLLIGVRTWIRSRKPIVIEVQEHRLLWQEGARIATLEYHEVERVEMVRGRRRRRGAPASEFPIIRFIEDDGEMLEMEVVTEDSNTPPSRHFDVHGITQAVLPYLRGYAEITPDVDDFVEHGLVDLDALPRR
jgi:hypothetical protein